jgi:hypothetical protein
MERKRDVARIEETIDQGHSFDDTAAVAFPHARDTTMRRRR